ncbi:uncharacterized protein LACBIDRAFT_318405, partial [Laccaria bicolor S238N-H82]
MNTVPPRPPSRNGIGSPSTRPANSSVPRPSSRNATNTPASNMPSSAPIAPSANVRPSILRSPSMNVPASANPSSTPPSFPRPPSRNAGTTTIVVPISNPAPSVPPLPNPSSSVSRTPSRKAPPSISHAPLSCYSFGTKGCPFGNRSVRRHETYSGGCDSHCSLAGRLFRADQSGIATADGSRQISHIEDKGKYKSSRTARSEAVAASGKVLTLPFLAIRKIRPRFQVISEAVSLTDEVLMCAISLDSLLVMFGFSVLVGPINHIKHLVSKDRLPFSAVYFGSLGLTSYFSLGVCITILDFNYLLTFLECQAHPWLGSLVVQVCRGQRIGLSLFIF